MLSASEGFQVFNRRSPKGTGACLMLANTVLTQAAGVLATGVFYTAFLALNGIDIVRIGLLGTIPSLCWMLSLFTPKLMSRFRSRRWVLFSAHMVNVLCTVLGTAVMPLFVQDSAQRTLWFGLFLLIGNAVNALFSSGATAWQLHFVPEDDHLRNVYYSWHNMLGFFVSTAVNLFAAFAADSLAGQPQELMVIRLLRIIAFLLYTLSGVSAYLLPKEYPYPPITRSVRFLDTLRFPLREKKFLLTASVLFFWTFMTSCNSSTWTYYLKETVGASYLVLQLSGLVTMTANFVLLPSFRRLMNRFSMPVMLRYGILGIACCQFFVGFVAPGGVWYYMATMIPNGVCWSLVHLCVANAFVYNLPSTNRDAHTVFWNLMLQTATFLGSAFGAWFLGMLGEGLLFRLFSLEVYSSQLLMWFKFAANTCLSFYIARITPLIRHADG